MFDVFKLSSNISRNLNWSEGLHIIPIAIGLFFSIRRSMKVFSISLDMQHTDFKTLLLHPSFFSIFSNYAVPSIEILESLVEVSNFDSVMPITVAFDIFAIAWFHQFLGVNYSWLNVWNVRPYVKDFSLHF